MCIVGLHRCAVSSTCALFAFGSTFSLCEASRYRSDQKRTAKVFAPLDRLHSLRSPSLPRKRGTPSGACGHADGSRAVYGYGSAKFWSARRSKTLALLAWLRCNYSTAARTAFATGASASLPSGGRSWLRRWPGSWRAALGSGRPTRPALAGRSEPKNDHSDG